MQTSNHETHKKVEIRNKTTNDLVCIAEYLTSTGDGPDYIVVKQSDGTIHKYSTVHYNIKSL